MRNSTFMKNGQNSGFVLQLLSTRRTAASGRRAVEQALVQSRCLWFLCEESCMSSSISSSLSTHFPLLLFLWNHQTDFWTETVYSFFYRGRNYLCICRQADLHYLNKDRSVPLSFIVYKWMQVSWQLRNCCKINSWDAHVFVCSNILSKPKWKEEVSVIQADPERFFFSYTIR